MLQYCIDMNDFSLMILVIIIGSLVSLGAGALIFLTKQKRKHAINIALPFGAGALLAAAFFDLLPESFEMAEPRDLLVWTLAGFILFFVLERTASWFHHHHDHAEADGHRQNILMIIGDLLHNCIDGVAIGAAFVASPATGIVTALAVSAHEIPKEIGTFGILLSRGWKDKKVLIANMSTALGTIIFASVVFYLGSESHLPVAEMLAVTAGFFIYIAASDIIPDIHEQSRKVGTLQALILVTSMAFVATIIRLLGV